MRTLGLSPFIGLITILIGGVLASIIAFLAERMMHHPQQTKEQLTE